MRAYHVVIEGRVQGVWFRDSMRQEAERVGVTGWVRNLPDGRVEALIQGDDDATQRMLQWCQDGPPQADVAALDATPADPEERQGFAVRR